MDELEKQLRQALGRKEPSPWFDGRVLDAAARQRRVTGRPWLWKGRVRLATAFTAGVLVISAVAWRGVAWREDRARHERAAGEAAKARLELALKITSVKLQRIQDEVRAVQ